LIVELDLASAQGRLLLIKLMEMANTGLALTVTLNQVQHLIVLIAGAHNT